MAQNYATAFNSGQMGIDLSNRMSNIKLDTEVDPVEIQALVNKYAKIEDNKNVGAPQAADTFCPKESIQNTTQNSAQNLTTYQPSAPVINNNADFQGYYQGYMRAPQAQPQSYGQQAYTTQLMPEYQQVAQPQAPQYAPAINDVVNSYSSNLMQQPVSQGQEPQGFSASV